MKNGLMLGANVERKERGLLEEIMEFGKKQRQLGLYLFIIYWYIQYKTGTDFKRLWRFYNNISNHVVHENTVRKQLELLMNKGLIEVRGDKIYPRVYDLEAAITLFDFKRSKAGKRGALRRLRKTLKLKLRPELEDLEIPRNLKYYVKRVLGIATKLIEKNRRWEALDLIAHTLLPLRENAVLWLWKNDEFIYFERKPTEKGVFHCIKFPSLAEALRKLGFEEGIMIDHIKGHSYTKNIIHRLFSKGSLSWPWARSIFYGLKKYGLAEEGSYYIIELERKGNLITLLLRDYYGNILQLYEKEWYDKVPEPLTNRTYYKSVVIGKQHIYEENECKYSNRF